MNNKESPVIEQVEKICKSGYREFCAAADFIWKSPNLLKHETAVELTKLESYFSENSEAKKDRWHYQSIRLTNTFPYMIAIGNLFTVLSLFETYLYLLAMNLQLFTEIKVSDVKGSGINRLFDYLKLLGLGPSSIPLHQQVQAAITVRNCFIHSSGILAWSRDETKLKNLQKSGQYLSPDHRKNRIENNRSFDELLVITTSNLGDRLEVSNEYTWLVSNYVRDYFSVLCANVIEFTKNFR
jgi:hypothetical protein